MRVFIIIIAKNSNFNLVLLYYPLKHLISPYAVRQFRFFEALLLRNQGVFGNSVFDILKLKKKRLSQNFLFGRGASRLGAISILKSKSSIWPGWLGYHEIWFLPF